MTLTRRSLLKAAGVLGLASALPVRAVRAQTAGDTQTVTLTTTVVAAGTYAYLPFDVPAGVRRIEVSAERSADAALGLGLFDQRGPGYQSAGFRGIYGEERSEFFIAADEASQAFLPGTIEPGTWTVVVPVFRAPQPTEVTVTVTLRFGPQADAFVLPPPLGVVREGPGWYRGDLHCHTPESSDAWASGTALSPSAWAAECRRIGLDYAAMTDHNVVSQNFHLGSAAGEDVLLMPGEEMTNWFHGHATVTGIEPDAWLDWRQRPAGVPLSDHEARITDFLAITREMGAYVSAAHPLFLNLAWQFFGDAQADPAAQTDAIEVWTGQFRPDCESALRYWDSLLQQGRRVFANGGSDLHGTENDTGFAAGTPTTVVYAQALSTDAVTAALRHGRAFVTRLPEGVEAYLRVRGPNDQDQAVGGTIYGAAEDVAEVEIVVRRAAGMRLIIIADGAAVSVTQIGSDDETVTAAVPIGPGGYVRCEVRGEPFLDPDQPLGSRMDMECFTNPVFLVNGPEPEGNAPFVAPPPPADAAPPQEEPPMEEPPAEEEPVGQQPAEPAVAAPAQPTGTRTLPATGAGPGAGLLAAAAGAGMAAAGRQRDRGTPGRRPSPVEGFAARRNAAGAVPMTMTEVAHHAGTGAALDGVLIEVVGEVTGSEGERTVLTRWVPSCCDDVPVPVEIDGLAGATAGSWWRVRGRWVAGTGAGFRDAPRIAASESTAVPTPPSRLEGTAA